MSHDPDRSKSVPRWRRLKRSRGASAHPAASEPHALELEACDRVEVADDQTMVRVAGRWTPAAPVEVALQMGDQILLPLPPGPTTGPDGLWRAAFAIDAADNPSSIALLTDSGTRVELAGAQPAVPAPTSVPEPEAEPVSQAEPAPLPGIAAERKPDIEEKLANALEDLADAHALADQLRKRCELSERGVADFREKLVQAWSEANEMRLLLDEREAAHVKAKERARQVDAAVAAVEQRLAERQRALVESREELKRHCDALENELVSRARSESSARARVDAASEREARLEREAADALARSEQAHASVEALRAELDAMRAGADQAEREVATAREREAQLQAQVAEGMSLRVELDAAHGSAEQAQQELASARERLAQLEEHASQGLASYEQARAEAEAPRAELEAARNELEAARASAEQAQQELATAREREAQLQAESSEALSRFGQAQGEAKAARQELEAARASAEQANSELKGARDELSTLRKNTISLSQSEHALRTKLDSLTRGDVGDGGRLQRRQKVSARAYRDALAQVEVEQAERQRLEAEAASLAARVRELESTKPPAVEPAAASEALGKRLHDMEAQIEARTHVEADLRRLFETSQEELQTARAEAAEARGRLAATPLPAPAGENGQQQEAKESPPWTGVDQELIDRIAKANQLAGSDG